MGLLAAAAGAARAQDEERERRALSPEGVAGDILDAAIDHCRRGETGQALAMFQAIREQLQPPPAILRLVQDMEATGCRTVVAGAGGSLRLQLGAGWDSNVSQGITARSLVVGTGENTLELELDESYRPRSSAFTQFAADYTFTVPQRGLTLQAALSHRKNGREPDFDLTTAGVSAAQAFTLAGQSLRVQAEAAETRLADRRYLRTHGLALQWVRPVEGGGWLATAAANRVDYLTQPSQDAVQYELGLLREWRLDAATTLFGGASLLHDDAIGSRPGGDRRGVQLQAGALVLAGGWRFRPQVGYTSFDSDEVFAPALIDVERRNRLFSTLLQAERPLSPQTSLVLEWRDRRSRDTVALYRYRAYSFTATLAHRF